MKWSWDGKEKKLQCIKIFIEVIEQKENKREATVENICAILITSEINIGS